MKQLRLLVFILTIVGLQMACNDPTIVGSELLGEEGLNVEYSDDISFTAKTVTADSIRTLANGISPQTTYVLGELNDPFFGYSKTGIYSEIHLGNTTPNFEEAVLDSAVLVMTYDRNGFYGDSLNAYSIDVYQLEEKLDEYDTLYSTQNLMRSIIPLGSLNDYVINKVDSVFIYEPSLDSMVLTAPHLRIPIDEDWAEQILMDTVAVSSDSALVELTGGLFLEASATGDGGYIGLNIGSNLSSTFLTLYYTRADTVKTKYEYPLRGRRHINIQHDYSGSPIEESLDDFIIGDSILYIQGLAGVNTELDFSGITTLGDVLINKAALELVVATLPEDNTEIYPPILDLVASKFDDSENLALIEDAVTAINLGSLETYFGGNLTEEERDGLTIQKYEINITNYAIRVLAGEEDPRLTISASLKSERPNRSIIFGPGNSNYPARLKLTYTSL